MLYTAMIVGLLFLLQSGLILWLGLRIDRSIRKERGFAHIADQEFWTKFYSTPSRVAESVVQDADWQTHQVRVAELEKRHGDQGVTLTLEEPE